MKSRFILIFLVLLLLSCNRNYKLPIVAEKRINYQNQIFNDTTLLILNDYVVSLNMDTSLLYQIFIEQNPDSIIMNITYNPYKSSLKYFNPDGYIKINNCLFLIYTGLSNFSDQDPDFLKALNNEIEKVKTVEDKFPFSPPIIDGLTWKVVFKNDTRAFRIEKAFKNSFNKMGPIKAPN